MLRERRLDGEPLGQVRLLSADIELPLNPRGSVCHFVLQLLPVDDELRALLPDFGCSLPREDGGGSGWS